MSVLRYDYSRMTKSHVEMAKVKLRHTTKDGTEKLRKMLIEEPCGAF